MTTHAPSIKEVRRCEICDEGNVSERTFIHLTKTDAPYPRSAIRLHCLRCDACQSDYATHEQSGKNRIVMEKLLADLECFSKTKALPQDMISCWSCRLNMYLVDHAHNDGHCPACNCEIDLEEFDTDNDE